MVNIVGWRLWWRSRQGWWEIHEQDEKIVQ
jgi:hypothetical protein